MTIISLEYKHPEPDEMTHLEECIAKINAKGGMKRFYPNEHLPRIPLIVEVDDDDDRIREITTFPESMGRNHIDSLIKALYDKETGKEHVTMPYGWCNLHKYLEDHGFETVK